MHAKDLCDTKENVIRSLLVSPAQGSAITVPAVWLAVHLYMGKGNSPKAMSPAELTHVDTLSFEEWYNMKVDAQWRMERPSTPAVRDPAPSLHLLPGGKPTMSPPDQMHTWRHGVGREFAASAIAPRLD